MKLILKKQSATPPHCTFLKDTPCTVISLKGDAGLSEVLICPGTMFTKDVWFLLKFCSSSFYLKACLIFFWANTSLSSSSMFMLKDYCEYFILTTLVLEFQDSEEKVSLNKFPRVTTVLFPYFIFLRFIDTRYCFLYSPIILFPICNSTCILCRKKCFEHRIFLPKFSDFLTFWIPLCVCAFSYSN